MRPHNDLLDAIVRRGDGDRVHEPLGRYIEAHIAWIVAAILGGGFAGLIIAQAWQAWGWVGITGVAALAAVIIVGLVDRP
ncbi:hypothetical protein [Corynebacterium sp.]|uniref:hypothetical protein n=1 Tax=Corynebacterium sp. TaxID=1720 RepID=UPI0025B80B15|nr:hypothetical protein [Corynebacterium sp.]